MADWPDLDEFKQVVNIDFQVDNWTTTLQRILDAAIARVKLDVGVWDDVLDEPTPALAQAALRMAELIAERPEAATEGTDDPTYQRLLFGGRKRFALA